MKKCNIFVFVLLFLLLAKPSLAQYSGISIPTQGITPSPTQTTQTINYDLPYPGILPGSPIYSLKAFRDKIVEILTTDPSKRSAFYLLQADKRLAASILLFDGGKPVLGEQTLSKSQNYLQMSIEETKKAKKMPKNIDEEIDKLKVSSQKQTEEINKLLLKESGEVKEKLKADLKRAELLEKSAEALD